MKVQADRNYVAAWIKKVTFDNGGSVMNCKIKVQDLVSFANEEGWASVTISSRKTPSENGATHFMFEDTYVPKEKGDANLPPEIRESDREDELPF
jgi:hypothetical protein